MAPDKRLYRSREALVGGVCAGVAEYFDIDPIVVRILAVVLTLASAGALGVAYIALWIILPLSPDQVVPVDVRPESVRSDTYGSVYYEAAAASAQAPSQSVPARDAHAVHADPTQTYAASGHVPPEPPASYADVWQAQAPSPVPPVSPIPPVPPIPPASPQSPAPSFNDASVDQTDPASKKSVRVALWFGFLCLFVGFSALLGHFVEGVSWWQFWPLLFIIAGIGNLVIPASRGKRMSRFVSGLMQLAVGSVLLAMSLRIIAFSSIVPMVESLWPLLVMMVGFFILAGALKNPLLELLAGACFVAFCAIGLIWFAVPGSTEYLIVEIPFKEIVTIDVNPWE